MLKRTFNLKIFGGEDEIISPAVANEGEFILKELSDSYHQKYADIHKILSTEKKNIYAEMESLRKSMYDGSDRSIAMNNALLKTTRFNQLAHNLEHHKLEYEIDLLKADKQYSRLSALNSVKPANLEEQNNIMNEIYKNFFSAQLYKLTALETDIKAQTDFKPHTLTRKDTEQLLTRIFAE